MAITPVAGLVSIVTTGNTPVQAAPASPNGGYITNPLLAADQGLGTAEPLYINPVNSSVPLAANGNVFALQPGQTWELIPGQTTPTWVSAASSGHQFTIVVY